MQVVAKVNAVSRVFKQLDKQLTVFKENSGLKCIEGCSKCCQKPNIEVTILEMFPAAYYLVRTGKYEEILNKIETNSNATCLFYNPFLIGGQCSLYEYRGLICRLFGFSTYTDKHEVKNIVACKSIKEQVQAELKAKIFKKAPEMASYYRKLHGIDLQLSIEYLNINEALKRALEIILFYFQYRKKPA